MKSDQRVSRREAARIMAGVAAGAAAGVAPALPVGVEPVAGQVPHAAANSAGALLHSVCKWCYPDISVDELARHAASFGMHSVELLDPDDWSAVKAHGLTCAMANGPGGIELGWNRPDLHDDLVRKSEELLPLVAEAGLPNMILFSGNRDGMPDSEGLGNCVNGIRRIIPLAEELGVTVCMELLNSKRSHEDYMCDQTSWGVELVQRLATERFKLLYDIFHMQIMEGDVIATIQHNIEHIAHFHTGGVPGRHEIDETQELNYRAICTAIVETGFNGYIAQEFIPANDPMTSLAAGVNECRV